MYSVVSSVPAIYHIKCLLHGLASEENKFSSIQVLFTLTRFSNHKKMANALILFLRKATEKKKIEQELKMKLGTLWNNRESTNLCLFTSWAAKTIYLVQLYNYALSASRIIWHWEQAVVPKHMFLPIRDLRSSKVVCETNLACLIELLLCAQHTNSQWERC